MTKPAIAVVIPTKDRWDRLDRFGLRAALLQRGVRAKVLVVDDGSRTPPPDLRRLNDPAVEVITLDGWQGVSAARNAGISATSAEWIAFLDDDDMWAPEKLAKVVSRASSEGADFGYSGVINLRSGMRPVALVAAVAATELAHSARSPSGGVGAAPSNLVVHRSMIDRVGGFDPGLSVAADWDYVYRLATSGQGCPVPETLVAYWSSNWHLRDEELYRADLSRVAAKHADAEVSWLDFDRWIASSLRDAGARWQASRRYLSVARRYRHLPSARAAVSSVLSREGLNPFRAARLPIAPNWLSLYEGTGLDH